MAQETPAAAAISVAAHYRADCLADPSSQNIEMPNMAVFWAD
jgi:hypothetical protein